MIIDITGIQLIPGNGGGDCPGNGTDPEIECCCDECDYMLCCVQGRDAEMCVQCKEKDCPRRRMI